MNQFVKTLIKKYKDPSIIGERSAEEVIHYLKQKFIIKDIKQSISDDQMKVYLMLFIRWMEKMLCLKI